MTNIRWFAASGLDGVLTMLGSTSDFAAFVRNELPGIHNLRLLQLAWHESALKTVTIILKDTCLPP